MAQIWRVVVTWSGGKIGTGYTNMFFNTGVSTAQAAADAAREFWRAGTSIGGALPAGVTLAFPAVVDTIEATNGQLTSNTSITAPAAITGADATAYSAVSGACVTWRTGEFVNGRRVRGRTFIVPLGGASYQTDGTLGASFLGTLNTAITALVAAAPEFCVWRRPTGPGAADGSSHVVAAGTVTDQASFLSSRR